MFTQNVYLPERLLLIWHLAELFTKRLPFLGQGLFLKSNTACTELSCFPGEPQCERGSVTLRRHVTGPLQDLKLKMKPENHAFQLTWNSREQNQTNSRQCFKSPQLCSLSVYFQDSRSCSEGDSDSGGAKEMLAPDIHQPRLETTHFKWKLHRWFAHDPKCQSPASASFQSSSCAYSAAHSTAPLTWLTDNSNLICPRPNSWFSTDLTTFLLCSPYQ